MVIKVVWLLYMFYRYKVVLYTVTLLKSLHSTQTTRILKLFVSKKSCQCGFCSFFKVKAQSMRFSFFLYISNGAGKYRAWLQKNSQYLFHCCCTKCWKNLEVQLGNTGGTVGFVRSKQRRSKSVVLSSCSLRTHLQCVSHDPNIDNQLNYFKFYENNLQFGTI